MMNIPLNNLKRQHEEISKEINAAINNVIGDCSYIGGPDVDNFEREYAEFCRVQECIGVSNGTEAIAIALKALGVGVNDAVITVANTFIATVSAITSVGATPLLVDVDPEHLLMDPEKVEKLIESYRGPCQIRAIVPVHLYGQMCDMASLVQIAKQYGLFVIEDAAQAHGAERDGIRPGEASDAATFSFYPGKNLGALGDAGAIITNRHEIASTCRKLKDHGRKDKYLSDILGTNARLDTLQAAVLRVKLKYLHEWTEMRISVAKKYDTFFCDTSVMPVTKINNGRHVYHLYVVQIKDRDRVERKLKEVGVSVGVHYPVPIHRQPAFHKFLSHEDSHPVVENAASRILSLPMDPHLTEEEISFVAETLLKEVEI